MLKYILGATTCPQLSVGLAHGRAMIALRACLHTTRPSAVIKERERHARFFKKKKLIRNYNIEEQWASTMAMSNRY